MTIGSYIPNLQIGRLVSALRSLPPGLCPERFSDNEDVRKAKGRVERQAELQRFLSENESGFFLFAERVRYDITARLHEKFATIFTDPLRSELSESEAKAILRATASADARFGFAADWDEYTHRNRYVRKFGHNHVETWVGRDLNKYLPGIYWLTMFSKEYSHILPTPVNSVTDVASVIQMDTGHWLVKCFERPGYWKRYAAKLDEWCLGQSEFFSKGRILSQMVAAPSYGALSELLEEWR